MLKHANEQIEAMLQLVREASERPGIQWTRVTRTSIVLAFVFFAVVYPALAFWLGMEYEATRVLLP
jgi:hypothetical protein